MVIKKVFKYKLVYWLTLAITLLLAILFDFASVNRITTKAFFNLKDLTFSLFIIIIAITSSLTFIFLIIKNTIAILAFRITITLIILSLTVGVLDSIFITKKFGNGSNTDYILTPIVYLLLFGLLYLVHKTKYKVDYFYELEEIGKHNN
ncbi:putative neutral ceramidase superfamily lipid hydrolase [Epilithonimonas hungarica]|nr:putative neutral ceramidase superfamily lipid hydrolase [Epilithonimonas hungarica]